MNNIIDIMRIILESKSSEIVLNIDDKQDVCLIHGIGMLPRAEEEAERKLYTNLTSRISDSTKMEYLGCTIGELVKYLESKFEDDMGWHNYGRWHIDHIKPISKFNLVNTEQKKKACHYTNLQPLWAEDNLSKGARYYED